MEDSYIIITINGTDYYIEADKIPYLNYIDNKLVNTSNSNITMVNNFDTQTSYPRITCQAMSQCILRTYSTSNYQAVTSNYTLPDKYNINQLGFQKDNIIILLLTIILGVKLIWKH